MSTDPASCEPASCESSVLPPVDTDISPTRRSRLPLGLRAGFLWLLIAFAARAPLVSRVEGMLDHDQAVVGLMALDIAEGRRLPIFFDGQRYMGAIEAYIAAGFVLATGYHEPWTIALAPTLVFGLFVAGQFLFWRNWCGPAVGHMAAAFSTLCSPMFALWSVIPRGGYSELLAWALLTIALALRLMQPGQAALHPASQFLWGLVLTIGYYINPLSLTVYAALGLYWWDSALAPEIRGQPRLATPSTFSPGLARWSVRISIGFALVVLLAVGCHVRIEQASVAPSFVFALGAIPGTAGKLVGSALVLSVIAASLLGSGAAAFAFRWLARHPWFGIGALTGLSPFVLYGIRVRLGVAPPEPSLPMWIRAPWDIGPNLTDLWSALPPLLGSDARAGEISTIGIFLPHREPAWPIVSRWLEAAATIGVAIVVTTIAIAGWSVRGAIDRPSIRRSDTSTQPVVLMLVLLGTTIGLYLLQASSNDASSKRYLLPVWIAVPGMLAYGLMRLPSLLRLALGGVLVALWAGSHVDLWANMDHESPIRTLVHDLERRSVDRVIAPAHVVLPLASLSHGAIGGLEYRPSWPRLGGRYRDRFRSGQEVVCVIDHAFREHRPSMEDLAVRIHRFRRNYPGRVRSLGLVGDYELWSIRAAPSEVLGGDDVLLPPATGSASLGSTHQDDHVPGR